VIGSVLGGLAVGNVLGGRLADGVAPRRALARSLLAASVLVMLAAWTRMAFAGLLFGPGPYAARIAIGAAIAWGPGAIALGTIPPALARASLAGSGREGASVGRVYAAGTVGAVVACVATSPALVPAVGTVAALALGALALAVASSLVARGARAGATTALPWIGGVAFVALAATVAAPWARAAGLALAVREDRDGVTVIESALCHVLVEDDPRPPIQGRRIRRMLIDGLVHGAADLDDVGWTGYGYAGVFAAVTDRVVAHDRPPRTLFIGGGGYVLPRRLLAAYPGSVADVAEIDPEVTRAAREGLGLPDLPGLHAHHEDARRFVERLPADAPRYDVIYGDAFDAVSVPFHLTTIEFARAVKSRLADGGVYVLNAIDAYDSGLFVGALIETLSKAFSRVALLAVGGPEGARDDAHPDNFVLVCSDRDVDLEGLRRADPGIRGGGMGVPVPRYGEDDLRLLAARAGRRVLTDDDAPVENLLAPIVRITPP
jgi:hypothetical protein